MSDYRFSEPSAMVQIELPDGRLIEGPRGGSLGEFLKLLQPELDSLLMAGIVNGELRELTYPVSGNADVKPVTMNDAIGLTIYKRFP